MIGVVAYDERLSGGVYQYTVSLLDALRHDDTSKYVVITQDRNTQFDESGFAVRKLAPPTGPGNKIGNAFLLLLRLRIPLFLAKREQRLLEDIELFITPTMSTYPCFLFPRPFIVTLHDFQERYYPQFFSRRERLRRWLNARALAGAASVIITESRFVKGDVVNFLGVPEDRVAVLPAPPPAHFLDRCVGEAELEEVKRRYALPDSFLLYPAHIWLHKNHGALLRAVRILHRRHPDLHLVLTGAERSGYLLLRSLIEELELERHVHHLGYIDYTDLPAVYRLSQMLVMPSLFESISIPVYEAFSLRVPVACSNVVALPEQVQDGGLLFDPNDPADMASQIDRILCDHALRERLSSRGHELVTAFDHRNYMVRLRGLIEKASLVGRRKHP